MKRILFICVGLLPFLMAMGSNDVCRRGGVYQTDVFGDLNGDSEVNISDINVLVDIIFGGYHGPVAAATPNMTIAEFKAKHWQDGRNYIDTVKEDEVIHGWITSSDKSGNIYKTLYICDESGAGLSISINQKNLYETYCLGQEIVIPMKGCFIGKYNGMQQIGYPEWYSAGNTWEATFLPQAMWESMVQFNGFPDAGMAEPVDVSLDEFAAMNDAATLLTYQGQLVRISGVQFKEADGYITFSESDRSTTRTLVDADGNELIVRNSNYADFAQEILPRGEVEVVGLLGTYGTTWQLYLRDRDDVTGGTIEPEPDVPDPVIVLNEGFDNALPENWLNLVVSGDKKWYQTTFSRNGYAAATAYRGNVAPFDMWLITPPLDIKNAASKVLTFSTEVNAYSSSNYNNLEVYLLDSRDPNQAAVKVKLNPALATPPSAGYSDWAESGDIDLSGWADGNYYYIGFRYSCEKADNYSTWCVDNVKFGE